MVSRSVGRLVGQFTCTFITLFCVVFFACFFVKELLVGTILGYMWLRVALLLLALLERIDGKTIESFS